jgi:2-methylisocitrate lyase-like PEP mutase family enzyme
MSAARDVGVDIVLNARVDVFLVQRGSPDGFEEAVRRARAYLEAGADCVYPIGLTDDSSIGRLVSAVAAPVNIYASSKAPTIDRLVELGVARVSLAGSLMRTAYSAVGKELEDLKR